MQQSFTNIIILYRPLTINNSNHNSNYDDSTLKISHILAYKMSLEIQQFDIYRLQFMYSMRWDSH